jgi:hypothetical protein
VKDILKTYCKHILEHYSFVIVMLLLYACCTAVQGCRKMEEIVPSANTPVTPGYNAKNIQGIYLLNEGNMGSNKASLDYFDYQSGTYYKNIFPSINPTVSRELGDVGNDIKIYGGKIYAIINCSNYLEVMDAATAKHITAISIPNCRYLAFHGGYAYVTSYAGPVSINPNARKGYVAKIDTTSLAITDTLTVGYQPEQMVSAGNKMYVANSGGYMAPNYDRTVSVINLNSFKIENTIDVAINLHAMQADSYGNVYVSSSGDYNSTGSDIYVINTASGSVTGRLGIACSEMTLCGDSLYVLGNAYSYATGKHTPSYEIYNIKTKQKSGGNFITDGTDSKIKTPYGIAVNPETREIFVTDAGDYVTPGTLYCFTPAGVMKWSATTGDIPAHIAFTKSRLQSVGELNPGEENSAAYCNKVYEFMPAPGQFVNEGYSASTMSAACSYALNRLKQKAIVSLGGFGGYIIAGFDHAVQNDGGYNIEILGNSFDGSSEPGIVYVMQDANGNGLPDDTWYELAGSEFSKGTTNRKYSVTYTKPASATADIPWTDSDGKSGVIGRNTYHSQNYYPAWAAASTATYGSAAGIVNVTANSLKFTGTRLPDNNKEISATSWVNSAFEWGYADNFSLIDRLAAVDPANNPKAIAQANYFKISNAIDANGNAVSLKYINFVKVQTGINCQDGWIGEESTEVSCIKDYNLVK